VKTDFCMNYHTPNVYMYMKQKHKMNEAMNNLTHAICENGKKPVFTMTS